MNGLLEPLFDIDRLTATALKVLGDPASFAPLGIAGAAQLRSGTASRAASRRSRSFSRESRFAGHPSLLADDPFRAVRSWISLRKRPERGLAVLAVRRAGHPWAETLGPRLVQKSPSNAEFKEP